MTDGIHKLDLIEVECAQSLCKVTRMSRLRIEVVRSRVGMVNKMSLRVDRKVLKWLKNVEGINEERWLKECTYKSEVEEVRILAGLVRCIPCDVTGSE